MVLEKLDLCMEKQNIYLTLYIEVNSDAQMDNRPGT